MWSGGALWLIDHGAALYWHHDWDGGAAGSDRPFTLVRDHVLLRSADGLPAAAPRCARGSTTPRSRASWASCRRLVRPSPALPTPAAHRAAYEAHFRARRAATDAFIEEAVRARAGRV